jgi:2-isopropylmalate synthase
VSLGHDAIGEVFVRIECEGLLFNGRSANTDIITGSVKAYLDALNRAMKSQRRKSAHQTEPLAVGALVA